MESLSIFRKWSLLVNNKIPCRYVLVLTGFFSLISLHFNRVNLSVVINVISDADIINVHHFDNSKFNWSHSMQGFILSSFFIGYMVSHIIGGIISAIYGPKLTLMFCVFGSSIVTFLMPMAIKQRSTSLFIILRIVCGVFSGPGMSAIHDLSSRWSPSKETTRITIFIHSGNFGGTLLSYAIGGRMVASSADGWISFFYLCSSIGMIWCIFAAFILYDNPSIHPRITEKERNLIIQDQQAHTKFKSPKEIPFRKILGSKAFYPLLIGHFCNNFIMYTYVTGSTKYFKHFLSIPVDTASYYSIFPFAGQFILCILSPIITDKIRTKNLVNTNTIRKINTFLGFTLSGIFILITAFLSSENITVVVLIMTLGLSFLAFNQSGIFVTMIEICPSLSGVIIGITNTAGSMAGIINPYVSGLIVDYTSNYAFGMRIFFILTSIIGFFGAFIFVKYSTSTKQNWDETRDETTLLTSRL